MVLIILAVILVAIILWFWWEIKHAVLYPDNFDSIEENKILNDFLNEKRSEVI